MQLRERPACHITQFQQFKKWGDDFTLSTIPSTFQQQNTTQIRRIRVALPIGSSRSSAMAAAASTETAAERRPPTLSEVLRPLNDIPSDQRAFGARQLLLAAGHLEETQKRLQSRPAPDVETLADQDRWVASTRKSECAVLSCRPGSVGCICCRESVCNSCTRSQRLHGYGTSAE